jgi:hypothetical protein
LFDENKTFAGFNLRHFLYQQNGSDYCRTVVENIFKLYSEGKVKPVVDSVWAFEDVSGLFFFLTREYSNAFTSLTGN